MGLRSVPVLVLAIALAVLAMAVAVWWSPKLTHRWWGIPGRIGLQVVSAVTSVAMVFVIVNHETALFPGWSDLVPSAAAPVQVSTPSPGGLTARQASSAPVATSDPHLFAEAEAQRPVAAPLPSPGQRLQRFHLTGERSGVTGSVLVYLPASYFTPAAAGRRYPVLMGYHGIPSGPETWLEGMRLGESVDAFVARRRLAETILVLPQVNFPLSHDSECVNAAEGGPQVETFLAQDVARLVLSRLRVLRVRSAWATVGYSSGGWCAAMMAMLHPRTYGTALVMSGYFAPEFNERTAQTPQGASLQRYNLVALGRTAPPPVAIWAYCGAHERWMLRLRDFSTRLKPTVALTAAVADSAQHQLAIWRAQLPAGLTWLSSNISPFAPA